MAKRQSEGPLSNGLTISITSFCHGLDGRLTGCSGAGAVFADYHSFGRSGRKKLRIALEHPSEATKIIHAFSLNNSLVCLMHQVY